MNSYTSLACLLQLTITGEVFGRIQLLPVEPQSPGKPPNPPPEPPGVPPKPPPQPPREPPPKSA